MEQTSKIGYCLFCEKDIEIKAGKKPRQFCNGNCRNKHYYRQANAGKPKKPVGRPKMKEGDLVFNDPKVEFKEKRGGKWRLAEKIDYKALDEKAYNGPELTNITFDEAGMWQPEIPPMPTRLPGEDPFDFAARKNEWKKKYNQ